MTGKHIVFTADVKPVFFEAMACESWCHRCHFYSRYLCSLTWKHMETYGNIKSAIGMPIENRCWNDVLSYHSKSCDWPHRCPARKSHPKISFPSGDSVSTKLQISILIRLRRPSGWPVASSIVRQITARKHPRSRWSRHIGAVKEILYHYPPGNSHITMIEITTKHGKAHYFYGHF